MKYEVKIEEAENGDLIIPLPEEMLKELGWKEGDEIDIQENEEGIIVLKKLS